MRSAKRDVRAQDDGMSELPAIPSVARDPGGGVVRESEFGPFCLLPAGRYLLRHTGIPFRAILSSACAKRSSSGRVV